MRTSSRRREVTAGASEVGEVVRVVHDSRHTDRVRAVWPPEGLRSVGDADLSATRQLEVIDVDGSEEPAIVVDGVPAVGGWCRLESELALFAAERLVGRVAVHAGLVEIDGRGILLPGPSFAGKSTMCQALSDLGADVRSDEYALIDLLDGTATGWARARRRRRADGGVDRIAVSHRRSPLPIAMVATLRWSADDGDAFSEQSPADAVLSVLANTVSARRDPDRALDAALLAVDGARLLFGTRGPAPDAARRLLAELPPARMRPPASLPGRRPPERSVGAA